MADTGTLHDAFVDELRDTYDAEKQITKALPKMVKAAGSPDLRAAFEAHLEETRGQVERLEEVFASSRGEGARQALRRHGRHHRGGQVRHGGGLRRVDDGCVPDRVGAACRALRDGCLRDLVAWARAMGHTEAADLLQQTLDEEKAADEKLSSLAEGGINREAADAAHPEGEALSVKKVGRKR